MKKPILYFIIGISVLCLALLIRNLWYYPLFKRPPIMEIVSDVPVTIPYLKLTKTEGIQKRYLYVEGDKKAAFPAGDHNGWSEWSDSHELYFSNKKTWIKLFVEEKWMIFKKRMTYLFYQQQEGFNHFVNIYRCRYKGISEIPNQKYSIYFVGDSITVGLYATDMSKNYASVVNKNAGKSENTNVFAVKGIGLNKLDKNAVIMDMIKVKPDLMIIGLGTNDIDNLSQKEFYNQYQIFLNDIDAKLPGVKKILLGLWSGFNTLEYDEMIYRLADQYKCKYIYLGDLFEESEYHNEENAATHFGPADYFHPSDKGHNEIAKRILSAIASLEKVAK